MRDIEFLNCIQENLFSQYVGTKQKGAVGVATLDSASGNDSRMVEGAWWKEHSGRNNFVVRNHNSVRFIKAIEKDKGKIGVKF